jgi:hypothetical protein
VGEPLKHINVMLFRFAMRNRFLAIAALCVLAALGVRAQNQPPAAAPAFVIRLPEYTDTKDLEIHYLLTGDFGGYGGFVRTKAGVWEYEIDGSYEGKPAQSLSAVIYCPGYQVETLDYPSLAALRKRSAALQLKPLATVLLSGKVSLPAGLKADDVKIDVRFAASWECEFFGLADCLVPSYGKVASAPVAEGGAFSVALPDFAHDSVVSGYEHPGHFTFTVSERKSGKYLFNLRSEGSAGVYGGLPLSPSYPSGQVFVREEEK